MLWTDICCFLMIRQPPKTTRTDTLFPYTPRFRSNAGKLDILSAALSLMAVLAVIYGLKWIAESGPGWQPALIIAAGVAVGIAFVKRQRQLARSEEHTSELQSLMRISYAVFCLKKKNKKILVYQVLAPGPIAD